VFGGVAAAQQPAPPGYRPAAVYGSPYPTTAGQPGGGFKRPGMPVQQPPQPAAPTGTTGRPDAGLPAGYRPVGGTAQPAPRGASAGQVMYFRKPANALAVDGMADAGAVAQVSAPPVLAPAVSDASVGVPPPPPAVPVVIEQPIPSAAPVPLAIPTPVFQEVAQPEAQPAAQPKTPPLKDVEVKSLPPGITKLPSRDKVFLMYDDATLQRAIIEETKKTKLGGSIDFPRLPDVVPPGTQYVSRTGTQQPLRAVYEPGFVVHRRLHFEEKNSERYGWDLGFAGPFVSSAAFYKDVLLWPNSLASGVVYGFWDTSAGKCQPGSPVPYYLYPPGLTITGTATEALIITGAAVIIP